jgi:hypothetical protein
MANGMWNACINMELQLDQRVRMSIAESLFTKAASLDLQAGRYDDAA